MDHRHYKLYKCIYLDVLYSNVSDVNKYILRHWLCGDGFPTVQALTEMSDSRNLSLIEILAEYAEFDKCT